MLFEELTVWKRVTDETIVRYRCLRVLGIDKYFVKCSDFYHLPLDQKQIRQLEEYFLESLFDDALESIPDGTFDSLEEAISAHELQFSSDEFAEH